MVAEQERVPCPIDGCRWQIVQEDALMCGGHWAAVPMVLKHAVWDSYDRDGRPGAGHAAACAAAIAAVQQRARERRWRDRTRAGAMTAMTHAPKAAVRHRMG